MVGTSFLSSAKEAAARAVLEWQQTTDDRMLYTATATTVAVRALAGATSITLAIGALLPSTGTFYIGEGATLDFDSDATISGNVMTLSVPLSFTHEVGDVVQWADDVSIYNTLGDVADPTLGGQLAGAAQA